MNMNLGFIPQANPLSNFLAHRQEIDLAVQSALESGRYINGPQTKAFEEEFAQYHGVKECVGVASGTDAIVLALRALGIGPGDLVISVSHTAVATIAAIEMAGAQPVLVDVNPDSAVMSLESLERTIEAFKGPRLKAILPVHLYGRAVNMQPILAMAQKYHCFVVEDCAQAHGAMSAGSRVGAWGDAGTFSFYPTKNLGAVGDGGAVVSNQPEIVERIRLLKEYGWRDRYVSEITGMNSRLDELQAAILRVKLRWLEIENNHRRKIAHLYHDGLAHLVEITLPESHMPGHVFHQYVIRCATRDDLRKWLQEHGVGTLIHYPVPVHLQPAYRGRLLCDPAGLPATEQLCTEIISLPMYPQLSDQQVDEVIAAVNGYFEKGK